MLDKATMRYRTLFIAFMVLGAALRIGMFWVNPPGNAFDNHFEPIKLIMDTGRIPGKLDCVECYQPPVFYWTSAVIGDSLVASGIATESNLAKFLQFLPCLYSITTLYVVFLILKLLPLSDFARLWSLGFLCFLPRHIYMSALHSNDSLSYLAISVCVYGLGLVIANKHISAAHLLLLSAIISVTIFTKYTAFIIIPVVFLTFGLLPLRHPVTFAGSLTKGIAVLMLPLVLLGAYGASNKKIYGTALPFNAAIHNPAVFQPHDDPKYDLATFKPWLFVSDPILRPGQLNSFWTLMYAGMWFDTEPKLIVYAGNYEWWRTYYGWLNGQNLFPADSATGPRHSLLHVGSYLEALGLVPLGLGITGLVFLTREVLRGADRTRESLLLLQMFLGLCIFDALVAAQLALDVPVFSAMKSSYVLTAIPAFCAFVGFGIRACEKRSGGKIICGTLMGALFSMVVVRVLQVTYWISAVTKRI